jgi:hypothetical protein
MFRTVRDHNLLRLSLMKIVEVWNKKRSGFLLLCIVVPLAATNTSSH